MAEVYWATALLWVLALLFVPQFIALNGRIRGTAFGFGSVLLLAAVWFLLTPDMAADGPPRDWTRVKSVSSTECARCHEEHYQSWYRTYHRTMTREATPEYVKGDFHNATHTYQGLTTKFTREGDTFYMHTVSPAWALLKAKAGDQATRLPPPEMVKIRIDRVVGSHWVQECLHRDEHGKYIRLPVLYHIAEKQWVHTNGAFLSPDAPDFWEKCRNTAWNETCLFCHNTAPAKNRALAPRGQPDTYETSVAELGISCEACHGPGSEHVQRNRNPARRLAVQQRGQGDPSIIHPERLSVERRDEICARCHGALVPKLEAWNKLIARDPFIAGQDIRQFNHVFWSEAEQAILAGQTPNAPKPERPLPDDGRFWGDGTPLTTALEYNGMALSACYEQGHGKLSCLSCHTMHGREPNFMLKPGMQTNEACYQCHNDYRTKLAEHTKHGADSTGSLCYNCHMPHQVFSLLTTHRSHRIQTPHVENSLGTGKPHACNLCHMDKSLGWTKTQLSRWPKQAQRPQPKLTPDQETYSHALLLLAQADARTRVIVAGAMNNPIAQQVAGTDWYAPFLTRLMQHERYPMVRALAHKALKSVHGTRAEPFDHMAIPTERLLQLQALQERLGTTPLRTPQPHWPLTPQGLPDEIRLRAWLQQRTDPTVSINE